MNFEKYRSKLDGLMTKFMLQDLGEYFTSKHLIGI